MGIAAKLGGEQQLILESQSSPLTERCRHVMIAEVVLLLALVHRSNYHQMWSTVVVSVLGTTMLLVATIGVTASRTLNVVGLKAYTGAQVLLSTLLLVVAAICMSIASGHGGLVARAAALHETSGTVFRKLQVSQTLSTSPESRVRPIILVLSAILPLFWCARLCLRTPPPIPQSVARSSSSGGSWIP